MPSEIPRSPEICPRKHEDKFCLKHRKLMRLSKHIGLEKGGLKLPEKIKREIFGGEPELSHRFLFFCWFGPCCTL